MTDTPTEESREPAMPNPERIAQMVAHRACHSAEHDPENGKIHGWCIVCGVPWPCSYAGPQPHEMTFTDEQLYAVGRAYDKAESDHGAYSEMRRLLQAALNAEGERD